MYRATSLWPRSYICLPFLGILSIQLTFPSKPQMCSAMCGQIGAMRSTWTSMNRNTRSWCTPRGSASMYRDSFAWGAQQNNHAHNYDGTNSKWINPQINFCFSLDIWADKCGYRYLSCLCCFTSHNLILCHYHYSSRDQRSSCQAPIAASIDAAIFTTISPSSSFS